MTLRLEYLHDGAHGFTIGQRVETPLGWGTIAGSTYRFSLVTLDGDDGVTPCDPGALLPRPVRGEREGPTPIAPTLRQNTAAQDDAMQVALAAVDRGHSELLRGRAARRMATVRRAA